MKKGRFRDYWVLAVAGAAVLLSRGGTADACCSPNDACMLNQANANVPTNPHLYVVFWDYTSATDPDGCINQATDFLSHWGGTPAFGLVTQYWGSTGAHVANPVNLFNNTTVDVWYDTSVPSCTYPRLQTGCDTTILCNGSWVPPVAECGGFLLTH